MFTTGRHGYFVQDDWKVTPSLTVNLGLRYELITPFIENHDLMVNFDPKFVDSSTGLRGRFIIPSEKTIALPGHANCESSPGGHSRPSRDWVLAADWFALTRTTLLRELEWLCVSADKSVIRGGYGFYYPTSAAQGIRDPLATNAFNQGLTKRNTDANGDPLPVDQQLNPWPGFNHGFSPFTGGRVASGFGGLPSINAVPVDLQQPRIQQYNVTFEREVVRDTSMRLSYLGSTLSGLIGGIDLNELHPSDTPFGTTTGDGITPCSPGDDCDYSPADLARQPFPGLGDYLASYGNFGHGRSNAFQAQLERRYSHGLLLNLAYTYLDQKSTALDTGNSSLGGLVYNPFLPNQRLRAGRVRSKESFCGLWRLRFAGWERKEIRVIVLDLG